MNSIVFIENGKKIMKTKNEVIDDFKMFKEKQIPLKCQYRLRKTKWGKICEDPEWDPNTIYEEDKIFIKNLTQDTSKFWLHLDIDENDYLVMYNEFFPGGSTVVFTLSDLISYQKDK